MSILKKGFCVVLRVRKVGSFLRERANFAAYSIISVAAATLLLSACAPVQSPRDMYFQGARSKSSFCFRQEMTHRLPSRQYAVNFDGCPETPLYTHHAVYHKGMHALKRRYASAATRGRHAVNHSQRKNTPRTLPVKNTAKFHKQITEVNCGGKTLTQNSSRKSQGSLPAVNADRKSPQLSRTKIAIKKTPETFPGKTLLNKDTQKLPAETDAKTSQPKPAAVSAVFPVSEKSRKKAPVSTARMNGASCPCMCKCEGSRAAKDAMLKESSAPDAPQRAASIVNASRQVHPANPAKKLSAQTSMTVVTEATDASGASGRAVLSKSSNLSKAPGHADKADRKAKTASYANVDAPANVPLFPVNVTLGTSGARTVTQTHNAAPNTPHAAPDKQLSQKAQPTG